MGKCLQYKILNILKFNFGTQANYVKTNFSIILGLWLRQVSYIEAVNNLNIDF